MQKLRNVIIFILDKIRLLIKTILGFFLSIFNTETTKKNYNNINEIKDNQPRKKENIEPPITTYHDNSTLSNTPKQYPLTLNYLFLKILGIKEQDLTEFHIELIDLLDKNIYHYTYTEEEEKAIDIVEDELIKTMIEKPKYLNIITKDCLETFIKKVEKNKPLLEESYINNQKTPYEKEKNIITNIEPTKSFFQTIEKTNNTSFKNTLPTQTAFQELITSKNLDNKPIETNQELKNIEPTILTEPNSNIEKIQKDIPNLAYLATPSIEPLLNNFDNKPLNSELETEDTKLTIDIPKEIEQKQIEEPLKEEIIVEIDNKETINNKVNQSNHQNKDLIDETQENKEEKIQEEKDNKSKEEIEELEETQEIKQIELNIIPFTKALLTIEKSLEIEKQKEDLENKNYENLEVEISKLLNKINTLKNKNLTSTQQQQLKNLENNIITLETTIEKQKQKDIINEENQLNETITLEQINNLEEEINKIYQENTKNLNDNLLTKIEDLEKIDKTKARIIEKKLLKDNIKKTSKTPFFLRLPFIKNKYFGHLSYNLFVNNNLKIYNSILTHETVKYTPSNIDHIKKGYKALNSSIHLVKENLEYLNYLENITLNKYPELLYDDEFIHYINKTRNKLLKNEQKLINKKELINKYNLNGKRKILKRIKYYQ